jgi:hypothetical protein
MSGLGFKTSPANTYLNEFVAIGENILSCESVAHREIFSEKRVVKFVETVPLDGNEIKCFFTKRLPKTLFSKIFTKFKSTSRCFKQCCGSESGSV